MKHSNKTSAKLLGRRTRKKRVRAKITGTDKRPRLSVFRSLMHNYTQLIDDSTGKVLAAFSDAKEAKGTKTERARAVGLGIAKKALEKNISECVFDRNGYKYHGRVKAVAEGAREGGLKF